MRASWLRILRAQAWSRDSEADTKNIVALDVKKTPRGALCVVASDGGTVNAFPIFENPDEMLDYATTFLEKNVHWVEDPPETGL